ncbi:hypothetical protein BC826DRAFT_967455 [Russula brevipes]|nr:hypothetical protein BC826DRAFT_967455 [Russula brevipes]
MYIYNIKQLAEFSYSKFLVLTKYDLFVDWLEPGLSGRLTDCGLAKLWLRLWELPQHCLNEKLNIFNLIFDNELRVCSEDAPFLFFMAMLTGILPKLVNLTAFRCRMDSNTVIQVLEILEKSHPELEELFISLDSPTPLSLPKFGHLIGFAFENDDDSCTLPNIQTFLIAHAVALRTLIIKNKLEPLDAPLSINNLSDLSLYLTISRAHCVRLLLENGQQLEGLELELSSEGCDADRDDPDLFLAVAEIVRGHPMLEVLSMMCKESGRFGYDASIWGVIPSLVHLRALSMDVPENMPSGLCGWLVPRTVVALALELGSTGINYDELIPGLPTGLKFLALPELEDLGNNLSLLPALRLVSTSDRSRFQTVCPTDGKITDLGVRQGGYYMRDWLVQLDCEEAKFTYIFN